MMIIPFELNENRYLLAIYKQPIPPWTSKSCKRREDAPRHTFRVISSASLLRESLSFTSSYMDIIHMLAEAASVERLNDSGTLHKPSSDEAYFPPS